MCACAYSVRRWLSTAIRRRVRCVQTCAMHAGAGNVRRCGCKVRAMQAGRGVARSIRCKH
eukprot:963105-Pleurochrysis_carterae.AAC.1